MLDTRKDGDDRGKIINIASLVSFQGGMTVPAYAAAKHGILGLTKGMSNDFAGRGINVNASASSSSLWIDSSELSLADDKLLLVLIVAPGYIATEMNTALIADPTRSRQILERIPSARWGTPEDFTAAILFLAGKGSDYVCGECVTVRCVLLTVRGCQGERAA